MDSSCFSSLPEDLEPVNGLGPASQQRNTDSRLLKARHPNPNASQGSFSNGEFTDDENETEDGQSQPKYGKKTRGRVKIKMQFIGDKLRRYTTFSKRKTGIMKKAYELSTLTGTQVMLLVASETGHVYTFATKKLQPMITSESGKALIQTCLNSPDSGMIAPTELDVDRRMNPGGFEETELSYAVAEEDEDDKDSEDILSQTDSRNLMHPNTSSANTFNINTILPPTSNGDGTQNKPTSMNIQMPKQVSLSAASHTVQLVSSSPVSTTASLSQLDNHLQLQLQQQQQQEQIQRLQQLQNQLQQQVAVQQQQQQQAQQQTTVQIPMAETPLQQQIYISKAPPLIQGSVGINAVAGTSLPTVLTAQGVEASGSEAILYQQPGQTVLYAPAAMAGLPDGYLPMINVPQTSIGAQFPVPVSTTGTPQYIIIPQSLASSQILKPTMNKWAQYPAQMEA